MPHERKVVQPGCCPLCSQTRQISDPYFCELDIRRDGTVWRLELRDVVAKYPFESSHRFPVIQPNSGHRDYSPHLPPSRSTEKSWPHFRPSAVDFCGSRLAIGAANRTRASVGKPAGSAPKPYKRDSSGVAPASPQVAYRALLERCIFCKRSRLTGCPFEGPKVVQRARKTDSKPRSVVTARFIPAVPEPRICVDKRLFMVVRHALLKSV